MNVQRGGGGGYPSQRVVPSICTKGLFYILPSDCSENIWCFVKIHCCFFLTINITGKVTNINSTNPVVSLSYSFIFDKSKQIVLTNC